MKYSLYLISTCAFVIFTFVGWSPISLVNFPDYKISTSYTKNDNHGHITSAQPTITITESHIIIVHRVEGGGVIQNTTLEGPNGKYVLSAGDNNVNPGQYKQTTVGRVTVYTNGPAGAIYSDVHYK